MTTEKNEQVLKTSKYEVNVVAYIHYRVLTNLSEELAKCDQRASRLDLLRNSA
jgi:hypothetical protein